MNPSNLLFGVLLTVIRFQLSDALNGADRIPLDDRHPDYTKTLVLDLDETLVHGKDRIYRSQMKECDGKESFPLEMDKEGRYIYCVHLRDGVVETLQNLEKGKPGGDRWELIIWTSGVELYAKGIRDHLQKRHGIKISHVIDRETSRGEMKEGEKDRTDLGTTKDLRRLINADSGKDPNPRTLETMVIVDNCPEKCYPGENTIGIRSWYGYKEDIPQWLKAYIATVQGPERSLTWSIVGHDGGEAMKQLKVELDELSGKRITLERLEEKLLDDVKSRHATASEVGWFSLPQKYAYFFQKTVQKQEPEQMIYYRAQPVTMSKQIERVNKLRRDDKYGRTVILDLFEDFVYITKDKECGDKTNCWEIQQGGFKWAVQFKDDALDTLRTLQKVAPDRWQSDELIIWTNENQELAEKISAEILLGEGIDIAHVLGTNEWDNAEYNFGENWNVRDATRLDSETRPLDSMMIITNKDPPQCLPHEIGLREFYSYKQIEMVKEAGRDRQYTKTLIMNLGQDFVNIHKDIKSLECEEKEDCWKLLHGGIKYAVQFRGDAINTLQELQQVEPGRDRWELIIWTDLHRKFADKISEILSGKGVCIAHILDGNNWNNVVGGSLDPPDNKEGEVTENNKEWEVKDLTQLVSDRRPLDSMIIVHNRPSRCFPRENTVGIRSWYGLNKSLNWSGNEYVDLSLKWHEYKWREYVHQPLEAAEAEMKYIDLSLTWPQYGSDDAMNQLKSVLDELNRKIIGDETLSNVIFSEPATTELVREKEQMVYFQRADGLKSVRSREKVWRLLAWRRQHYHHQARAPLIWEPEEQQSR